MIPELIAQIENNLGNTYRKANDYHRASLSFMRAVQGAQLVGDRELECTALGNLGLSEFELGQYARAKSTLHKAIACAAELGDKRLEASHTGDLGNVYRAMGKLIEAEVHCRRALTLAQEIADPRYEEIGKGDLGILLAQLGRANEAITLLKQACALSESIGETADAARDAYHLSTVYRDLGEVKAEEAALQKCLRLAEVGSEWSVREGALHALAYNSMMNSDYVTAEQLLKEADEAAALAPDPYNSGSAPHAWGYLAYHQNKYVEAEHYWDEAFRRAKEAGNVFGMLSALIDRGSVLIMLHRLTEAESVLQDALKRAQTMSLPDDERMIWEVIGAVREQQQDYEGACMCYEHALTIIESGRSALALETHRMGFLALREGPYLRLTRLFVLTDRFSQAWEICERARSRSLVDILANALFPPPTSLPESLVQAERELLPVLRMGIFETSQSDTRHVQIAMEEINRLRAKLDSVWEEMAPLVPEYVDQRRGQILKWKDIKEVLS